MRHLREGKNFVRQNLAQLRILNREPLVSSQPIAHEKGWGTIHCTRLQILANGHFADREIGNVSGNVRISDVEGTDTYEL